MVRDIVKFDTFEKKIIPALLLLILFLGVFYVYFVSKAVFNVVARRSTEEEMGELGTRVGDLVLLYMDEKGRITGEHANSLGFREFKDVTYVSRKGYALLKRSDL